MTKRIRTEGLPRAVPTDGRGDMASKSTKQTSKKSKNFYETAKDPVTGKPVVNPKTGKPVKVVVRVD